MLVLDGNMKNRRHVCNARDAGYIEYPGLPGKVKTGCMLTPEYKSKYCSEHKIRACNFSVDTSPADKDGTFGRTNLNSYACSDLSDW